MASPDELRAADILLDAIESTPDVKAVALPQSNAPAAPPTDRQLLLLLPPALAAPPARLAIATHRGGLDRVYRAERLGRVGSWMGRWRL